MRVDHKIAEMFFCSPTVSGGGQGLNSLKNILGPAAAAGATRRNNFFNRPEGTLFDT